MGTPLGTLDFAPPEQIESPGNVDIRVDIYALGCTFYTIVTGEVPYPDSKFKGFYAKMDAQVRQPPPSFAVAGAEVDPAIEAILQKMCAKDREQRYKTSKELVEAIDDVRKVLFVPVYSTTAKQTTVFSYLGSRRDVRENEWRPNVALAMHNDLRIDRLELFYEPRDHVLLDQVCIDLKQVAPQLTVVPHPMPFDDPWNFEEVYAKLFDFMKPYRFNLETEEYLIHIKTGTQVLQICYFLLIGAGIFPGKLLQSLPPRPEQPEEKAVGSYKIIDIDPISHLFGGGGKLFGGKGFGRIADLSGTTRQ